MDAPVYFLLPRYISALSNELFLNQLPIHIFLQISFYDLPFFSGAFFNFFILEINVLTILIRYILGIGGRIENLGNNGLQLMLNAGSKRLSVNDHLSDQFARACAGLDTGDDIEVMARIILEFEIQFPVFCPVNCRVHPWICVVDRFRVRSAGGNLQISQ